MAKDDSEGFSKYVPQHPLPEEIKEMTRDETVCQYCGVSYLIHNEIKKLEDKIKKYKEEIQLHRGWKEEQKNLLEKLAKESSHFDRLKESLKEAEISIKATKDLLISKEKDVLSMSIKLKHLEELREESQNRENKMRNKIKQCSFFFLKTKECCAIFQSGMQFIKGAVLQLMDLKQEQFVSLLETLPQIMSKQSDEMSKLKESLKGCEREKASMQELLNTENIERDRICAQFTNEIKQLQTSLDEKNKQLTSCIEDGEQLKSEHLKLKEKLNEGEKILCVKDQRLLECKALLEAEHLKYDNEIKKYKSQLQERQKEVDEVRMQQLQCQQQLTQFHTNNSEAETLLLARNDEIKGLKLLSGNYQQQINELKKEREQLIGAHQSRIQQLRESFFEKLREADVWPNRMKDELTKQQQKFNEEKAELWQELSESHQKDMVEIKRTLEEDKKRIVEEKTATIRKLQTQLSSAEDRWREEHRALELRLEKEKENSSEVIKDQVSKINKLEERIRNLEQELSSGKWKNEDAEASQRQRQLEELLRVAQQESNSFKSHLAESQRELDTLHETVRRECEERLELTEALAQARTQLLSAMRSNSSASHRSFENKHLTSPRVPSPPSSNRSGPLQCRQKRPANEAIKYPSSPSQKDVPEEESRRRIAAALGRLKTKSRASTREDGVS